MKEKNHTPKGKESAGPKRVLVVSHSYLPSETSAALQTVSLVRKLPEAGWKPTVLTAGARWQYLPVNTDTPGPGVEVIRTALWRPLSRLERLARMTGVSGSGKHAAEPPSEGESSPGCGAKSPAPDEAPLREDAPDAARLTSNSGSRTTPHPALVPDRRGPVAALRRAMRALYWKLRPTDPNFLFPLFALSRGYGFARRNRPSAVYSIGKPFSSLVAGQLLARILRLPHVVEFHDPWTLSPSYRGEGLAAWFEKRLERWVVAGARGVVAKTRAELTLLRRGHPGAEADFFTVTCGFDETTLPDPENVGPPASKTDGVCRILHSGSLSARRNPVPFLTAVRKLVESSPDLKDGLKLVFVGRIGTFEGLSLSEWGDRLGLTETLDVRGWTERRELIRLMGSADIFLLLPDYAGQIPAKVYEYLWFGRRILVVDEAGSESAELVESLGRGLFAPSGEPSATAEVLRSLIDEARTGAAHGAGDERLRPFSARGRAGSVADILNAVSS